MSEVGIRLHGSEAPAAEPTVNEEIEFFSEFAKFTFLGPFLCTSLFAEDDCRIADKLKTTANESRPIVSSLQQEVELTRNLLHKVNFCLH